MNKILDIQKLNISVDNLLSQKKLISDISFNIKKSEPLPEVINLCGYRLPVLDGDISDSRFDDTAGCIIGLRFKQPRGTIYSKEDISNFCVI